MHEARYRGAKLVVIAPDYNATAIHADLWINVKPETDAALGLAAAQVIVEENLYDADYVREQTDLPILVRDDNARFLARSRISQAAAATTSSTSGTKPPAPGAPYPAAKAKAADSLALERLEARRSTGASR